MSKPTTQPSSVVSIAIDGNEANVPHRVGSNVYAFELITALSQIIQKRTDIHCTILTAQPALEDLPKATENWQYKVISPRPFWTQWGLPLHLFLHQHEYHVFFTPGHYAPRFSSVKYVSSVMDLAFLHFPHHFKKKDYLQLKNWTEYSVKRAKKIITISQFSKEEIITWYQQAADKIVVAFPGITKATNTLEKNTPASTLRRFKISQPYILHLGTLQPRKNIIGLIEAFEILKRLHEANNLKLPNALQGTPYDKRFQSLSGLQLVLAGKEGWLSEPIIQRISKSPFKGDIVVTGFISEIDKLVLLKEAVCLAMVGTFEGFGIPALEAQVLGTIPVVSSQSSLPEVVGKAGILVDPSNPTSIADGIKIVAGLSAKEKATFRKEGRQQIQEFSWIRSAEIVLSTLLEVAREK